jgi:hypothetical protein
MGTHRLIQVLSLPEASGAAERGGSVNHEKARDAAGTDDTRIPALYNGVFDSTAGFRFFSLAMCRDHECSDTRFAFIPTGDSPT